MQILQWRTSDDGYDDEDDNPNMRHYTGYLGDFKYDPTQFQIQMVEIPETKYGPASQIECLRYIGKETDGRKIDIPDGVVNGNFMFAGTNIESTPELRPPLRSGFQMFANCDNLQKANAHLPATFEDGSFMFANCKNLQRGPRSIPGTCQDMSYMFSGCNSIKTTPAIGEGVRLMDGAFGHCKSLKNNPHIPKSAKSAVDTTFDCPAMDKSERDVSQEVRDKRRAKYEKKLNKPSFGSRISGAFSAVMQVYSLKKMGFGVVAAPFMVHSMRKQGVLGRDMGSGIAAIAMSKGGVMGRLFYNAAQKHSANVTAKKEARKQEKLAVWDRLYGEGSEFNSRTKKMAANSKRDFRNGLFTRINYMTPQELRILGESHGHTEMIRTQSDNVASMDEYGDLNVNEKKDLAKWFKDQVMQKRAYVVEARNLIETDRTYSKTEKAEALDGLDLMTEISIEPIAKAMKDLQRDHNLFDIRDQKDIDDITGEPLFDIDRREKEGDMKRTSQNFTFVPKEDVHEPKPVTEEKSNGKEQ